MIGKVEGGQNTEGMSQDSQSKRGTGWVLLNGEPRAHAHCNVTIVNARPGVDGTYYVSEAEHNYTRGVGYTTRCNVQNFQPKEGDYNWYRKTQAEQEEAAKKAAEEATKRKAEADEKFIEDFANTAGWGYPVAFPGMTDLDKRAARRWYEKRDRPIPPEFADSFEDRWGAFGKGSFDDRWSGIDDKQ